jgi:hypothetical protein
LVAALVLTASTARAAGGVEIWVSATGNDANAGTKDAPVATLARAQALERTRIAESNELQSVQQGKPLRNSPITVRLEPGDYMVPAAWSFGAEDSAADGAPVTWRGTEPGKARLLGCRPIPADRWTDLTDPDLQDRIAPAAKGKIKVVSFADAGLGALTALPDYGNATALPIQLYEADQSLPLSRWPNGRYNYTTIQTVLDNGGPADGHSHGGIFVYRDDEPARWVAALGDEGVWVRGFWRVPWEASTIRVSAIDPTAKTISLAAGVNKGIGSKYGPTVNGVRAGDGKEKWCALNLLEEIDTPGEWSIDFKRGKIYLWPVDSGVVSVSDNVGPLVTFSGASHVEFRNLGLGWNVGSGVKIDGGDHVTLAGCNLHQIAGVGILITSGTEHAILGNDISDIGQSAIDVSGGDRATLTPCKDEIDNNRLINVAASSPVPAIVAGITASRQNVVGIHVAHNLIDGASYGGITFGGNDDIFEYNEICRVGLDGGDLGGFYTTGGWTSRGNIVRYNFVHHAANCNAIYMDDGDSGLLSYGNLFFKVATGPFIGGGHDNIARNNLIVDCERGFHVDDRGVSRKYNADDHRLRGDFDSVPVSSPVWSKEYPGLADFLSSDPAVPSGNVLEKNIVVGCGTFARKGGNAENLGGYQFTDNAELPSDDIFKDVAHLDFGLKDPATLTKAVAGFEPIPFAKMGLVVDANRAVVPPRNFDELNAADAQKKTFDSQQDVETTNKNAAPPQAP